jgi:hypothetical protein
LPGVGPVWPLDGSDDRTIVRTLEFVEVEMAVVGANAAAPSTVTARPDFDQPPTGVTPPASFTEPRWSLWAEPEA